MKLILKNIRNMVHYETPFFIIMCLCVYITSIVLSFAFCLYVEACTAMKNENWLMCHVHGYPLDNNREYVIQYIMDIYIFLLKEMIPMCCRHIAYYCRM